MLKLLNIAKQSIKLLNSNPNANELEQFRQYWINFITTYDDSFLAKLNTLGKVDSNNLKKTIESLNTTAKTSSTKKTPKRN